MRLKRAAARIAALEPVAVALAAPFLLFPTVLPAATVGVLVALLGVWLAGWFGTGRLWTGTPLNGALLLFALTIPISVWASTVPDLSLPKLTGLILGLATFRATVNAARSPRRLQKASVLFLILGLGLALVGALGANWYIKWPALEPLLARMPRLLEGLPGAAEGIPLPELAGALLLFLPVALARLVGHRPGQGRTHVAARLADLVLAVVLGGMLLLSQSRSAWLGALAAIGVMAWLRWPRQRGLMAAGLALAVAGFLYVGPPEALQTVFAPTDPVEANWMIRGATLEDRVMIWSSALHTIQDSPLTGCGLGAFRHVVNILNPVSTVVPGTDIAHAHNVFLQVALDLGLPGLIAYLALVGTALWIAWCAARSPLTPASAPGEECGTPRWLGLGIVGSLVAFHVYGLTDAVALGAKPGFALWMLLGMAAALWPAAATRPTAEQT